MHFLYVHFCRHMNLPTIDSLPQNEPKRQPVTRFDCVELSEVYTPLRGAPRNDREFENSHPLKGMLRQVQTPVPVLSVVLGCVKWQKQKIYLL